MSVISHAIERFSVKASQPFEQVLARLRASLGQPDVPAFRRELRQAASALELEAVVRRAVGDKGLMEFAIFDFGEVLRKQLGGTAPKSVRLLIGNPLIMTQLVRLVPDAGLYVPVTVLVDERHDGVHLSYDKIADCLEAYGNVEALQAGAALDSKLQSILLAAAE